MYVDPSYDLMRAAAMREKRNNLKKNRGCQTDMHLRKANTQWSLGKLHLTNTILARLMRLM